MEKKQLDFNAPLLSVRRFSSPTPSSHGDTKRVTENSRYSKWKSLPSYQYDMDLSDLTKPAAVPFVWEQIPGKRKGGNDSESQTPDEPSNTPRLPPGRTLDIVKHISQELSQDRNFSRPQIEPPKSINNAKGDTDLESCNDAFSDALDTLSTSESFSFSCSISGLSGYDGLDTKPSRTFYADPQTRDLMMSRFLPAAKAMVLETPLYVPRKQPVGPEPPRNLKKVVSGEMRPLLEQYRSEVLPRYDQYVEDVESEDEDEKYVHSGKKIVKACGLLPRFCIKNSLCILNPVPVMKGRTQAPMSPAREVRRLTRTAFSGPLSQTVNKHDRNAVYKKPCNSGPQSRELYVVENKRTRQSNGSNYSGDLHTTNGLSPHRRSRGGGISPYRNGAPRSPFHEGARFLGVPKVVENVKATSSNPCKKDRIDLQSVPKVVQNVKANSSNPCKKDRNDLQSVSSDQRYKQGLCPESPAVEKTLYIDSVSTVSISSEAKGIMGSFAKNFDTFSESKETTKADQTSFRDVSGLKSQTDRIEGSRLDRSLNHEARSLESLISKDENTLQMDGQENLDVDSLQSPAPVAPPLPKSPSESWLWRAMPSSILSRSSFPSSKFGSNYLKKGPETSSGGTKWETIVKSSKSHYDHVRYSEELIPHVTQHSKT